jgi:hypothetical protein
MPRVASLSVLNADLLDGCRQRLGDRLRGHGETIGERLVRDLAVFQSLPATRRDAYQKKPGRVSSLSPAHSVPIAGTPECRNSHTDHIGARPATEPFR